jgi:hypothetical protein
MITSMASAFAWMRGCACSPDDAKIIADQTNGQKIIRCGGADDQVAKICNNLILGISMIAVSEVCLRISQKRDRTFANSRTSLIRGQHAGWVSFCSPGSGHAGWRRSRRIGVVNIVADQGARGFSHSHTFSFQIRTRLHHGERQKGARGEPRLTLAAGLAYDRAGMKKCRRAYTGSSSSSGSSKCAPRCALFMR